MTNKSIQNLIFLELISEPIGDDGKPQRDPILSKSEQDEIYKRRKECEDNVNWEYVFEPIQDSERRDKLISLFKELDK